MNKADIITAMAVKNNMTKTDNEKALTAFLDVVKESLAKDEKIQLVGFGSFETVERAARVGRNPQTGEELPIAACKSPKFKPATAFKEAVNG